MLYSQLLPTNAIGTDGAAGAPYFCAVFKRQTKGLCWLPGPPVAPLQLAAKGVAALRVGCSFEVEGIFL